MHFLVTDKRIIWNFLLGPPLRLNSPLWQGVCIFPFLQVSSRFFLFLPLSPLLFLVFLCFSRFCNDFLGLDMSRLCMIFLLGLYVFTFVKIWGVFDMFHSEIRASLIFIKNKTLSPGLENIHTLKCCSGNFPTKSYMSRLLEKYQINIWVYCYSSVLTTHTTLHCTALHWTALHCIALYIDI